MAYFSSNYNRINYPISDGATPGLRNAQIGAIHAIGAHFSIHDKEPALIVMPTGSGKTAVLNLSAYLLRANRVLVISSSVLVRGQIKNEFSTLKTLKESSVFAKDIPTPTVKEIRSPIKSMEEWEALKDFDAVIGIPNSINEGINLAFGPPKNLFDLILVDEAHHVPAFTWTNIIEAFPHAKKIFFTATPFRRDKREIKGKIVFSYPLSKAYEDKIFGDIGYYPVLPNNEHPDLAIAKATEAVFKEDKEAGLRHFIMVRTETKEHADALDTLYKENTSLSLIKVDSTKTYSFIKKTIEKLKAGELDGIICVDMLGEGFDFPNLKIAAIHSPKKSLANTMQFIGRFARTNAADIGEAKFLAIPSDIEIGKKRLYAEGAIWNDIIKNLSQEVVDAEDEIKRTLDTFHRKKEVDQGKQISFYNLNPYCHVKVYKAEGVLLNSTLDISGHQTIHHAISEEMNTAIYITKEIEKPKWIISDDLINVKHYFFLIYFDEDSQLLFIHSSIKTPQFYDSLIERFAIGKYGRISKYQLNKVLADIKNPEFFNIGMQNRSANSGESYRIVAGPNAETSIRKSHGKNYANGHVFMKGLSDGDNVTVGYSSGSKVWSNAYQRIPDYIKWCQSLAKKIVSDKVVKTNTAFDDLPIGVVVDQFPLQVHGATWNGMTFNEFPLINEVNEDEIVQTNQLLDFEIIIDNENSSLDELCIVLVHEDLSYKLSYNFTDHFKLIEPLECNLFIEVNGNQIPLIDYFNDNPFQFYLDNFATVSNHEYFAPPDEKDFQFDSSRIVQIDWVTSNTDIKKEFYKNQQDKVDNANKNSIHETLNERLMQNGHSILIYDHGTGEVADFIAFHEYDDRVEINLYHVKGSGGVAPGDRVNDVYEVCMQAVKSQAWTCNKQTFRRKILDRVCNHDEKFLIGDSNLFKTVMDSGKRIEFFFTIVQPGISQADFSPKLSYILAAADDYITNNGYQSMIALGS